MKTKIITGLVAGSLILTAAVDANAQMAKTGLKKGQTWDRSVEATQERKAKTSKNADDVNAAGSVIDGDSDAPSKVQKKVKLQVPPEDQIKRIGTIPGEVKAKGGLIDGTSDGPNALTSEEIKMLTSNGDIVICGKTGEIVGSKEWKKDGMICKRTNFKVGSPRDQLILLAEQAKGNKNDPFYLSPKELSILKSQKDVQLSGKTGEIIGLQGWDKKDADTSPRLGFNKKSPRYKIILHYAKKHLH